MNEDAKWIDSLILYLRIHLSQIQISDADRAVALRFLGDIEDCVSSMRNDADDDERYDA